MPDPIPEGCIRLVDAWDLFRRKLWNGGDPVAELSPHAALNKGIIYGELPPEIERKYSENYKKISDLQWQEIIHPLSTGILQALVRPPGSSENFIIPHTYWPDLIYPEQFFMEKEIARGPNDLFFEFSGRTPFLKRVQFDEWLADYFSKSNKSARDNAPVKIALHEHLMSVAWDELATPTKLEEAMARWGLPSLTSKPNPDLYDPMKKTVWTLAITVAWIVWRTPDAVRDNWSKYREECVEWAPVANGGWELSQTMPATLYRLMMLEALSDPENAEEWSKSVSVKTAREALWDALTEGNLTESAISMSSDETVDILSREWACLVISSDHNLTEDLLYGNNPNPDHFENLNATYRDVSFLRRDVLDIWEPMSTIDKPNEPTAPKVKRGPKFIFDWDGAKDHLWQLLDEHGAPTPDDPDWSNQADMERALADYFRDRNPDLIPSDSSLRENVPKFFKEWLVHKASNSNSG